METETQKINTRLQPESFMRQLVVLTSRFPKCRTLSEYPLFRAASAIFENHSHPGSSDDCVSQCYPRKNSQQLSPS